MKYRPHEFVSNILILAVAIMGLNLISHAQSVTISSTGGTSILAPASYTINASPSGGTVDKVVFYRNDVPFHTDTTSTYDLLQTSVGQETYTYRARVYFTTGDPVDSADFRVKVTTPNVFRMGDTIPESPPIVTKGPDRTYDHKDDIQDAIDWLESKGGGTLFFPCSGGPGNDPISIYNIDDTVVIPSNVTLQGESSEEGINGPRCRIYWTNRHSGCVTPNDTLDNKSVFKVEGTKSGVRFRDLSIVSRTNGRDCGNLLNAVQILGDNSTAIELDADSGSITDTIFENVSITAFTYGIKAIGNSISDLRIRGVRASVNHRQLYIDTTYAYDWDVQNLNITTMLEDQGGVELIKSGKPSGYSGENGKLKFLQLNCNGNNLNNAEFCVSVTEHEGLYFKQLHHEGVPQALTVNAIASPGNAEPIVLEGGTATGEFSDPSMKLYLIGNAVFTAPEDAETGTMKFLSNGKDSTIVDCGDTHFDRTDVVGTGPSYDNWKMLFTHSERNRTSFFIPVEDSLGNPLTLDMPHTVCPKGVTGSPNIDEVGGEFFDSGVLPVEPSVYVETQIFDSDDCNSSGDTKDCWKQFHDFLGDHYQIYDRRTLVIRGEVSIKQKISIPSGSQIVGIPDKSGNPPILEFTPASGIALFEIVAPVGGTGVARTSGITIRDLAIYQEVTQANTTGISMIGVSTGVGELSDVHFSGLSFEGLGTGFYGGRNGTDPDPMLDGLSVKNVTFINNQTAFRLNSSNASNWNVINLDIESNSANAEGWDQSTGLTSLQGVTCLGTSSHDMKNCVQLEMGNMSLTGLEKTQYVKNVVTIKEGATVFSSPYTSYLTSHLLIRHSDLRTEDSSKYSMRFGGKGFVTSMNNQFDYFDKGTSTYQGELSRVTTCGDTGGTFSVLETLANNNYIGLDTPTVNTCGTNPVDWEDAVKWGAAGDKLLVGNFHDDVVEDHVLFRPSTSTFWIRESQGNGFIEFPWGTTGDQAVVGRFHASTQRSQVAVFRESTGKWWIKDPVTSAQTVLTWGTTGDIAIVGNFFPESGTASDQRDEIAIYRPSTDRFWVMNPRTYATQNYSPPGDKISEEFQVGDFLKLGYEQIAQIDEIDLKLNWHISNLYTYSTEAVVKEFGDKDDVLVAGNYFDSDCTQLGVWNPGSQEFRVADFDTSCTSSAVRTGELEWGLNYGSGIDDVPLVMHDGNRRAKPTAYRLIANDPVFTAFKTQYRWWVHDPIDPS